MRIFAFRNRKRQLLSNAMRALGRENTRIEEIEVLKWRLSEIPHEDSMNDIIICPEWVRNILLDLKSA